MHVTSFPPILYFGTPVVLVSTQNPQQTPNLAPISSIFWLGWRCVIGVGSASQTAQNLLRTRECVLNLPSQNQVREVNLLAKTTGANPISEIKLKRGYRFVDDKFGLAGLTPELSSTVDAFRVGECPVQLEAHVEAVHSLAESDEHQRGKILTFELKITKVHLEESILMDGESDRVDPDKWKPLIMSFQEFYTTGNKLHYSTLAEIPESTYNTLDREAALVNSHNR